MDAFGGGHFLIVDYLMQKEEYWQEVCNQEQYQEQVQGVCVEHDVQVYLEFGDDEVDHDDGEVYQDSCHLLDRCFHRIEVHLIIEYLPSKF